MNFSRVVREVATFFEREGFPFAVIGAFGLHAYGLSRATSDMDFVTDIAAQPGLVRFIESLGYETLHLSAGYSNHLHADPALGRLDFVYVGGDTSRRLFEATRLMPVLEGIVLAVPRAEHLAAMKVQAMKNDPDRTFQPIVMSLRKFSDKEIVFVGAPGSQVATSSLLRDSASTMDGVIVFNEQKEPHIRVRWEKVAYEAKVDYSPPAKSAP